MKILFVTVAPLEQGPVGLTSFLASARYRAIIPAEQLSRRGHEVHVRSVGESEWTAEIVDFPCDVLVVSKSLTAANEARAREIQARGVKVVVDICDNVFSDPKYGGHFGRMARLADSVTCGTEALAEVIRRETGRDSTVITDPVEGRMGVPRFAPRLPALRVLWFGNPLSLEAVRERAAELSELCESIPVELTIVASPSPALKQLAERLRADHPGRLQVKIVFWSLEGTWRALEETDVVWIPSGSGEFHWTKSPNRLVESLWAGRVAAADAIPSYIPFEDNAPLGKRLAEVVFASLDNTAAVEARVSDAQRKIARMHSPHACGLAWAAALGDTAPRPLRLHMPCGNVIVDGYVNMDETWPGSSARPDITCHLCELSAFSDGVADEVLSTHGIERFERFKVLDVLREWVRVLKPGGKMAIECANLADACRVVAEGLRFDARLLFGDSSGTDPITARRWGYSPETLAALLREAGLTDTCQEPPQFPIDAPGRMRVVGRKRAQ